MRPVNLIPPEDRPGGHKPLRSGPVAYIIVGALAAAVIALTALVVTEDKVSDRKAEVARLQQEQQAVESKAQALAPYTEFSAVREQRTSTVASLADSRFDWKRVLEELSLLLPADIQLTNLAGTASPGASTTGGAGIGMRSQIPGPALEVVGCGTSQAAVAGFIEALKDIDGVTRVGVQGSSNAGGGGEHASSAGTCGGGGSTQFQMVAAFDAAPLAPAETGEGEVAPEAPAGGGTVEGSESIESSSGESSTGESESAAD
jgi:Tfp pilus assembly protein PilN